MDLRGIDNTAAVSAEPREHEWLRRRERARRVGECRPHCGGVRVSLGRIRSARAFDDRTESAQLERREQGVCWRAASVPIAVSDIAGTVPVTDSTSTMASAYKSARPSSGAPDACSGAAYRAVPTTEPAGSVQLASASAACQTEVGDSQDAVLVEEQVRRLDVAVHEPAHVCILERRGDLGANVDGLGGSQVFARVEQASQAPAAQQLEHHERHVVIAPVVDRHHVRMVQGGGDLCLGAEAPEEAGVVGERGVEHFHRHPAPQPGVVRDVDATARARADRREQAVSAGKNTAGEIGDATDRHAIQRTGHHDAERGTPERYPRAYGRSRSRHVPCSNTQAAWRS